MGKDMLSQAYQSRQKVIHTLPLATNSSSWVLKRKQLRSTLGLWCNFPQQPLLPCSIIYTACLLLDKIPSLLCYLGVPFQFFEQDVRNLVMELEGWLSS